MTEMMYTDQDSKRDGYDQFEQAIQGYFHGKVLSNGNKMFTTNMEDLYELYLANLPSYARQHYTCNACRRFINRFGSIVIIDQNGQVESAVWHVDTVPAFFKPAVKAMKTAVESAKVNGIFIPESRTLGTPEAGGWSHLSLQLAPSLANRSLVRTAGQQMAERREDFRTLMNALVEFTQETIDQAIALLDSETLYRADRIMGPAKWFSELKSKFDREANAETRRNLVWLALAGAPTGYARIRSSMVGTLLQDIQAGYSARTVAARFAEKMNPENYMRAQTGPSASALQEAEKLVDKLGISQSLKRRYAQYDEIEQFLWESKTPTQEAKAPDEEAPSVFGHIQPKQKAASPKALDIPAKLMTWEKFESTVLPSAEQIELLVDNPNRFMAMVTASDPLAPNILQWDNPFSWYYHGGIDGEIKRRVEEAGGRYENNEIRASLIWEGGTDLDIHCVLPNRRDRIYFSRKRIGTGYLDIDANGGGPTTMKPVENIRWKDKAPEGEYKFFVHNFAQRGKGPVPFTVELEVGGQVFTHHGVAGGTSWQEDVFVFNYEKGKPVEMKTRSHSAGNNPWGVGMHEFAKVEGITNSPNLWGAHPKEHVGNHIFFLIDGMQDDADGKGRGFFNETLKPELREIRKTLEAYTANTPIDNAEHASACGVGYSKDAEWNVTLRVRSKGTTRMIKIDRWD